MNKRLSPRDRGLIKGAIRRVFSRSELRKEALRATIVEHYDPNRPRVTRWSKCNLCQELIPTYLIEVDHVQPIVPIYTSLEDMSWDTLIDRVWCAPSNLMGICPTCHRVKTQAENSERRKHKRSTKKV